MVEDHVYESAVHGRRTFREAFRLERAKVKKAREALLAVRSKGIVAGAAFALEKTDREDRCNEVFDLIDATLADLQ